VMQPVEGGALELFETRRNEAAGASQHSFEPLMESDVQAVRNQMTSTEDARVGDQLFEREADRGIVSGDNGASARADNDIDGNIVRDELLQHADVTGAAQASTAEHHPHTNGRARILHVRATGSSQGAR
jgi:hypothetical protein